MWEELTWKAHTQGTTVGEQLKLLSKLFTAMTIVAVIFP